MTANSYLGRHDCSQVVAQQFEGVGTAFKCTVGV